MPERADAGLAPLRQPNHRTSIGEGSMATLGYIIELTFVVAACLLLGTRPAR